MILASTFYVVRTPLLSSAIIKNLDAKNIRQLMCDPKVREAVALSSPQFLERWNECSEDDALLVKAFGYLTRMATRPIPYGTFSITGLGHFGPRDELIVPSQHFTSQRLLSDVHVDRIYRLLAEDWNVIKDQTLTLNSTIKWLNKNSVSLYAWAWPLGPRKYHLAQYELPAVLSDYFKKHKSFKTKSLMAFLKKEGAGASEAKEMIQSLVSLCILIPGFHPRASGGVHNFSRLIEVSPQGSFRNALATLQKKVKEGKVLTEEDLPSVLKGSGEVPLNVQAYSKEKGFISNKKRELITQAVEKYARAFSKSCWLPGHGQIIEVLKKDFKDMFDASFVPLPEAMNLLEFKLRLAMSTVPKDSPDGKWENFWITKFLENPPGESPWTIELTDEDWKELERIDQSMPGPNVPLPSSFSAVLTLGEETIRLRSLMGPPGLSMLGRFSSDWTEMEESLKDFIQEEEKTYPNAVLAEVEHFATGKVNNISIRARLLPHEIGLVTASDGAGNLDPHDLYLGVREGQFVLWSKSLNKRVIPQLSAAHAYQYDEHLFYRFLCLLRRDLSWSTVWFHLGKMAHQMHLPRIQQGPIIFSAETWKFDPKTFPNDLKKKGYKALGLPRFVQYLEVDRYVVVDLENPLAVMFLEKNCFTLIDRQKLMHLEECIHDLEDSAYKLGENSYNHQVIIPFVNKTPRKEIKIDHLHEYTEKYSVTGKKYTYIQLFLSSNSDYFLTNELFPFLKKHEWFFIRFSDPSPHIRLRVLNKNQNEFHKFMKAFQMRSEQWLKAGLVYNIQLPTYMKELESYGGLKGVDLFEKLSILDSKVAQNFLANYMEDNLLSSKSWPSQEIYEFLVHQSLDYIKLLFPDPKERLAFIIENTKGDLSYPMDEFLSNAKRYITKEKEQFTILKSQYLQREHQISKTVHIRREKIIRDLLRSCADGTVTVTPGHFYFRMVHLLGNRLSWSLRTFHEQRIHQTVKAVLLKEQARF